MDVYHTMIHMMWS